VTSKKRLEKPEIYKYGYKNMMWRGENKVQKVKNRVKSKIRKVKKSARHVGIISRRVFLKRCFGVGSPYYRLKLSQIKRLNFFYFKRKFRRKKKKKEVAR